MSGGKIDAGWRKFIGGLVTLRVVTFAGSDNGIPLVEGEPGFTGLADREEADLTEANAVSSQYKMFRREDGTGGYHAVAIDIDIPAWLIPSTTPGHSHLYVGVWTNWDDYVDWLRASAKIGLIEDGYAEASIRRGHSDLRLPWVSKDPSNPHGFVNHGAPAEEPVAEGAIF